jgi:phage repressor protein C with HTH and peptisase S24 domain
VPELLYKENQRALWVTGDSMEPTLTDHSLVGVDVLEGLDPVAFRRRIIAARHEGGVVVKRLECDDKHLILLSDNPRYQPIVMDNDAAQDAVIGPVVWVWQQL